MSSYQDFLDFFSTYNKQRLDGLTEGYFSGMSPFEREMAFDYLLRLVKKGGTEESVNGIFIADPGRATSAVKNLLESEVLREEAEIAAAWNLYKTRSDMNVLPIFLKHMSSTDSEVRGKAAYYVPAALFNKELKAALEGMIRTETDQLARIHAVDKLLECYGVTKESVGKEKYRNIYRGLHSDDVATKEGAFKQIGELDGPSRLE